MDPLTSSVQIGGLNALSAYSHLIIVCSVFAFSVFSAYVGRGFFYLFWVAVVSGLRLFVQWVLGDLQSAAAASTYSTYILCFTMMYLATPGAVVGGNVVNYPMMMFFLAYIIGDIYARSKHVYGSVIPYTATGCEHFGRSGSGYGNISTRVCIPHERLAVCGRPKCHRRDVFAPFSAAVQMLSVPQWLACF